MGDHTAHLKKELEELGNRVLVATGTKGQEGKDVFSVSSFDYSMYPQLKELVAREKIDRILWQYVPYSYQRKGLPFWWPLLMLRLAGSGVKQHIFFHEVSLRWWGYGLRQLVVASGQRIIANLASLIASGSFTSIPLYAGYFVFKKPVIVPISANVGEQLADGRGQRAGQRTSSELEAESCEGGKLAEGRGKMAGLKTSGELRAESGEGGKLAEGRKMADDSWKRAERGKMKDGRWQMAGAMAALGKSGEPTVVPYQIFCFANRADRALMQAIKNINAQARVKLVLGGMIQAAKKEQLVASINELNLEKAVCFTGTLAPDTLAAIIAESAIFIQPQIVERKHQGGISAKNGTVMAAMAMGKAIITCGGDMTDPAIFKDGENMLLVPYGDSGAYKNSILRLLTNPAEKERVGGAAAVTYREQCSWEVTGRMVGNPLSS